MSFVEFVSAVVSNPILLITVLLNICVIMSNGWNDAPNAIATCVSTRCLAPRVAILMAAICNFLGVLVMTSVNASVASTIYNMVDFGGDSHAALVAVCAAMVAIVVWSASASMLGIPTSCSHALIAGISGAAVALQGGFSGIIWSEWVKIIIGLVFSVSFGFILGWCNTKLLNRLCRNSNPMKSQRHFRRLEVGAGAAMAFMHGAQDGQKFMGIFLLCIVLAHGSAGDTMTYPLWLMLLCSLSLMAGCCIGGMKIIKSVGMKMVKLTPHQGFAADISAVCCLFISSMFGLPVSTTHTKTTAVMGVGAAKRLSAVNWGVAKSMLTNWILTFPCCGLLGYLIAKLFFLIL